MNPLLLGALMSFAPGLLSHLLGNDPQAKLRQQIFALLSPKNQAALTNQFYQQNIGSPAYSQAQNTIAAGANQTGNNLAASLGARGIGTSGSASVLSSLVPSIVGSQQAGLRTAAYGSAQDRAMQTLQQQLSGLIGTSGPSQGQQMFGAGLSSFGPLLQRYLAGINPQYRQVFGNQ